MLFDPKWEVKAKADPWRQTLLDAAKLISKRGLAKGTQEDEVGRLCIHGAISVAAFGKTNSYDPCQASDKIVAYLQKLGFLSEHDDGAAPWNNHPERTKEEVIAVLRACAND